MHQKRSDAPRRFVGAAPSGDSLFPSDRYDRLFLSTAHCPLPTIFSMTHVVHPYAHRLGIIRDWRSRWFASDKKQYRENIKVDAVIRKFLVRRLRGMYAGAIDIERTAKELKVILR